MVKTIGLILLIVHMIGCNSAIIGYFVGTTANDTKLVRQLQHHNENAKVE
jgi:hypothetical protein